MNFNEWWERQPESQLMYNKGIKNIALRAWDACSSNTVPCLCNHIMFNQSLHIPKDFTQDCGNDMEKGVE